MKKTSIIKSCEVCAKEFKAYQYSLKNGHGRFCSLVCKSKKNNGREKIGDTRNCLVCKKTFYVAPWEDRRSKKKTCSPECYHKSTIGKTPPNKGIPMSEEQKKKVSISRGGKLTGKNNHSWKGGITPENKKIRASIEYRLWREAVFARDNWTCVKCGVRGHELHADHINPFSLAPELRLAIDNGQSLCVTCHKEKTKTDLILIRAIKSTS